jgi:hypothetical protein
MNLMKQALSHLLSFLIPFTLLRQIGIGTTRPHPSSMVEVSSTNRGFLQPRLTIAERMTISTLLPVF